MKRQGTAIFIINFSKDPIIYYHQFGFFDKERLLILNALILKCLKENFNFKIEKDPNILELSKILPLIFNQINTAITEPVLTCFFSHLCLTILENVYAQPLLIRINNEFFLHPGIDSYAFDSSIIASLTEKKNPTLFRILQPSIIKKYPGLQQLKPIIVDNKETLLLPKFFSSINTPLNQQLHNFYALILQTANNAILESKLEMDDALQSLLDYLTAMKEFFNP